MKPKWKYACQLLGYALIGILFGYITSPKGAV